MSLSVKYTDAPDGVQETLYFDSSAGQAFGSVQHLQSGAFADTPWATLEPNSWALDGSRKLLPDDPSEIGWWSKERSGEDGRFKNPPSVEIGLYTCTAPGLTFRFWPSLNSWCSEMKVTWYYGEATEEGLTETVRAEVTAYPDAAEWFLAREVKNFNKVKIELLATNVPGQFAKLQHIQIGQVIVFLQDELVRVSLLNEADPSACELPADELTVEILDKKDRRLRPQKKQSVQLYRNGEVLASHYVEECTQEDRNRYIFRCQSVISQLEDTFLGRFYDGAPLEELLADILKGFAFFLDPSFHGETITGYLPICTRREALQQVAFAIGAVIITQGDGVIQLLPLETEATGSFSESNIFTGAKMKQEKQPATVQISVHHYAPSEEEEILLDGAEVPSGGKEVIFTFSEPHHSYYTDPDPGPQGSGWNDSANYAEFSSLRYDWLVKLIASKYIHSTQPYSRTNGDAAAAEKSNIVKVEDATLIHAGNVNAALDRLEAYHKLKTVLTQRVVVDGQKVGQLVESINPWGTVTVGYITGMESEFTATGHTANVTIRGAEVQASEAEVLSL